MRRIFSISAVVLVMSLLLSGCVSLTIARMMSNGDYTSDLVEAEQRAPAAEAPVEVAPIEPSEKKPLPSESAEQTEPFTAEKAEYLATKMEENGYLYITPTDLQKYCANLAGVKIYTVTQVSDIKENKIQCSLGDGYMMSNFEVEANCEGQFKRGDPIALSGQVDGYDTYSIMGTSVQIKDCEVLTSGEQASLLNNEASDERLAPYFELTSEVVKTTGAKNLNREEFISVCKDLSYSDILRHPDTYEDICCVVSGRVDQIVEGWFNTCAIYIMDSYGNKWHGSYLYQDGESHLLEGDRVTVYGICNGTATSTTVLGKQVTMPIVNIRFIEQ